VTGVQTCALPISIDYLVKPIFPDDLHRSIQKAKNYFGLIEVNAASSTTQELIIKSEGEWLRIEPSEILFLKSMQNYVIIHLANFKPKMVFTATPRGLCSFTLVFCTNASLICCQH